MLLSTRHTLPALVVLSLANAVTAVDPVNPPVGGYIPTVAYSAIAASRYAVSTILLWIYWVRMERRRYMLVLTIAMTCMTTGLFLRIGLSYADTKGLYIIMTFFILLSPCAFLATDYVLLAKLAQSLGTDVEERALLIQSQRIAKIFIGSDVATFLLQAAGGGISASDNIKTAQAGEKIALAGLSLQLASFGLFTLMLMLFGYRVRKQFPNVWYVEPKATIAKAGYLRRDFVDDWRVLYYTMLISCIGILTRSAFRIAEYSQGYYGYVPTHEAYVNLLDFLPLFLAMSQYILVWPTRFIREVPLDGKLGSLRDTELKSTSTPPV